jgi:hypothetical protein
MAIDIDNSRGPGVDAFRVAREVFEEIDES